MQVRRSSQFPRCRGHVSLNLAIELNRLPLRLRNPMTSSIRLNCSILGPSVTAVFGVQVSLDNSVSDLKKIIKKELEHELTEIDAHRLVIWKVSDSPQLICHR